MNGNPSRAILAWYWVLAVALFLASANSSLATDDQFRTLYIAPNPVGIQNGSDWANAGSLGMLSMFIAKAGPGGKVLLKADDGPYRTDKPIVVKNGGAPEAPVTIAGTDSSGRPMKAEIVGTRADPWSRQGKSGSEVFRLSSGADNLRFEQIFFRNQGNGCFQITNDIQGLVIREIEARNVQRFVENHPGNPQETANINGLHIQRVVVRGYSKGAIRLQSASQNITIEEVLGDSERQDGDNFAIGVALEGTVHNVLLRHVTMINSYDSTHEYWNGDGFTTERHVYNVQFEDTVASGSTDAGYDLKSIQTSLLRAHSEDNKRNFRIWGNSTIKDCVSRDPHKRGGRGAQNHFWIADGATARIVGCQIEDTDSTTTVFEIGHRGELTVQDARVNINPSARFSSVRSGGSLDIIANRNLQK